MLVIAVGSIGNPVLAKAEMPTTLQRRAARCKRRGGLTRARDRTHLPPGGSMAAI